VRILRVQHTAPGIYDPTQQQLSEPHLMMQSQHGKDHQNNIPQVQPPNSQMTPNTHTQSSGHQLYDISFPALPEQNEPPWNKVEYKKRPRDTPENNTETIKQPTLNNYWLNQPPIQTLTNLQS
jgi:hypothetical protein